MNAPLRLTGFGLAAVIVLGGGAALGATAGPAPAPTSTIHAVHEESPMSSTTFAPTDHADHGGAPAVAADHRLDTDATVIAAGAPQTFRFRVVAPDGAVVTGFEERHERLLHLIVVSNDLTDYAHLHPQLGSDGTWSVELPALTPGGYRVIADTVPVGGPDLVLTADLIVPGSAEGRALPEPVDAVAVDDLEVSLALTPSDGGLTAGLTVRRDGTTVEPEPYLGARGHVVAIDADDLGYLHVHPEEDAGSPTVRFVVAAAAPGRYRLFFDFAVDGRVRTAAFTVDVTADPNDPAAAPDDHPHAAGEEHR